MVMSVLLKRLKEIREDNEKTQQDITDILEVKRGSYASWECGSNIIPLKNYFSL